MINEQLLRRDLQKLLKETDSSIRERLADEPELSVALRERHAAAVRAERTDSSTKGYSAFADETINQAAVHWLLACVFVRFLEDNGWLDERSSKVGWLSGPGERLAISRGRRTSFLRPDPDLTDRDYLLHVFGEVSKLPGVAGIFDPKHNPLYSLQPTGPGVGKIVEFFQRVDPDSNALIHDFTDPAHHTRFLGDLYQNLSESARKRYALCQTPGFVIDFILDRTLTPALDAFGLDAVRLIDPACGSGHFLLAAFGRLVKGWEHKAPATNASARVQRALDAVHGVDLNPFAVEISGFRLLIAALESSGIARLKDAPNFRFNLAAGDSLLHGARLGGGGIDRDLFEDRLQHFYDTEHAEELKFILGQQYHVVVGNPPYINVGDAVLREAYRRRFTTCHGKYQLGVPFTERFFDLTIRGGEPQDGGAGWMGMIVSNAFMKRSFGKKLVENYLRHRDLTHVVDTSGVYLPGHGTPTAILFGRNQSPVATTVRAVRGTRGETEVPEDAATAVVWREIVEHVDQPGFAGRQVSVSDAPRESFARHPWAIGGGGAAELKEAMDEAGKPLGAEIVSSGFASFPGQDDAFWLPTRLQHIPLSKPFAVGETCNDWHIFGAEPILVPYDANQLLVPLPDLPLQERFWALRRTLKGVISFGGKTIGDLGLPWWGWYRWIKERYSAALAIAFRHIASHNHFVFNSGGVVFNQHSPVIKYPPGTDQSRYISILGLLNSSAVCFWLKQVCFPKGGDTVGQDGARVRKLLWDVYFEFDSAKLEQVPVPSKTPFEIPRTIQDLADDRNRHLPDVIVRDHVPTRLLLDQHRVAAQACLAKMISLQEELDWQCYHLYGIIDTDLTANLQELPPLEFGKRAFEIALARSADEPEWFSRQSARPITELPTHWPQAYQALVERRLAAIESNPDIALIERPEYKRRWNVPTWEQMERDALRRRLLDQMELNQIWSGQQLVSCGQLRDALALDQDWLAMAELYRGGPVEDLDKFVTDLAISEAVPFLPQLRYTDSGLRKRSEWELVWKLQRQEDAGDSVEIPVPPKYSSKDFLRGDYWRLRGGLDVPKERFVLYAGFQRDSDDTPVLGWGGWSYLEQAKALAVYYQRMRDDEGWGKERLKPLLAGLLVLRDWLKQWHDHLDPETGVKLGTYFAEFAEGQCQDLGFSPEEVLAWVPLAEMATGRSRKSRAK